jgi:hypothetical protein
MLLVAQLGAVQVGIALLLLLGAGWRRRLKAHVDHVDGRNRMVGNIVESAASGNLILNGEFVARHNVYEKIKHVGFSYGQRYILTLESSTLTQSRMLPRTQSQLQYKQLARFCQHHGRFGANHFDIFVTFHYALYASQRQLVALEILLSLCSTLLSLPKQLEICSMLCLQLPQLFSFIHYSACFLLLSISSSQSFSVHLKLKPKSDRQLPLLPAAILYV